MHFFPGTNTIQFNTTTRRHRFGKIGNPHARNFRHKHFTPVHLFSASNHKTHALSERDPEARHTLIGNRHSAGFALLFEQRNDAASASNYIAVSYAREAGTTRPRI